VALSIDELLAVEDRPVTPVWVPAWNAHIPARVMTGVERDSLGTLLEKKPTQVEQRRAIFARCLCDADGNRLKPDVINKILEKSSVALQQLSQALSDLNGLSEEAQKKLLGKPEENSSEATASSG
jgi:hypothetical protein